MYRSPYRRRRRLNKGRFFTVMSCLIAAIVVIVLALKGKLPFMPDELKEKKPTPTTPAESATPTPVPTPWPTPEPMPRKHRSGSS